MKARTQFNVCRYVMVGTNAEYTDEQHFSTWSAAVDYFCAELKQEGECCTWVIVSPEDGATLVEANI